MAINIAEGTGRRTRADFRQFLHVALGSAREAECLLLFACNLGYCEGKKAQSLLDDARTVEGMLVKLLGRMGTPDPREG